MKKDQIAEPRMVGYGCWEIVLTDDQNREHTIVTTDSELVDRINYDKLGSEDFLIFESYFN